VLAQLNLDQKLQLDPTPLPSASKVNNICAMARTHLDCASSLQIRRAADSLYYRQYAFLKLLPHEVQKIADIKDTLSNSAPVLERQGLQQFPERVVRHFKPGERQGFLSVSQQSAWLEVSMTTLSWQGKPPPGVLHQCIQGLLATGRWSARVCFHAHT